MWGSHRHTLGGHERTGGSAARKPAFPHRAQQRLFSKPRTARKDYGSQNATEREKTRRVLEAAGKCSAVGAPRAGRNSVSRQPGGRRLGELRNAVSAQPREGRGLGVDLGDRARQVSPWERRAPLPFRSRGRRLQTFGPPSGRGPSSLGLPTAGEGIDARAPRTVGNPGADPPPAFVLQLSQPALRCSPPACWRSAVPSAAQPSRPDARR